MIFSIGYGNEPIDQFISVLKKYEISTLIDTRAKPFSKYNPSFNKDELCNVLENEGIRYKWYYHLNGYAEGKSNKYWEQIRKVNELGKDEDVVLMCCEANPDKCHRKLKLGQDLEINHLYRGEIVTDEQKVEKKEEEKPLKDEPKDEQLLLLKF